LPIEFTPPRLAGKSALVTGAAQGLGAAIAWMLARHGAQVLLADINGKKAAETATHINVELGAKVAVPASLDVRKEAQWRDVVECAETMLGGLSVLVNNAGVVIRGSIEDLNLKDWLYTMDVNVNGVFLGAKLALPVMRRHQPGSIINISSIAGLIASHNFAAYNASKAAVWMLTKSIALHCAREGLDIRCNSVHPSFIDTPMLNDVAAGADRDTVLAKLKRQVPLGRIGQPDDVAYAVLYLASDESRFMTGAELKLDGGISAM